MTDIIDGNTFVSVPLIEVGDPVKGGVDGVANKQAIALASRTKFLKTENEKTNTRIGDLNAADIGADKEGTAAAKLQGHVQDPDPHVQYLTRADAILNYLALNKGNQPNGFLQLDDEGKIPPELISLISTEYLVVADETARLAIGSNPNLIIVAQADIDTLFYLNGGLDPSVSTNWVQGQSATVSGVSRVYGRTGEIVAQLGDYTADQITETLTRLFATPTEKQTWNNKQDKLVSGVSLKTFLGGSLLGEGDIKPSPDDLGAAKKIHTHVAADVTDLDVHTQGVVGGMIRPGTGIAIAFDSVRGIMTVASTKNEDGSAALISYDAPGMTAGQAQSFAIASQAKFNMLAVALKKEIGAQGSIFLSDSFTPTTMGNYTATTGVGFNDPLVISKGGTGSLVKDGSFYSTTLSNQYAGVTADTITTETIIPILTSATSAPGYTPTGSDYYSQGADQRPAWYAFNDDPATGYISKVGPSTGAPVFVAIQLPAVTKIYAYQFSNRAVTTFNNNAQAWTFQGSNDGTNWTVLDTRSETSAQAQAPGVDRRYTLSAVAEYQYYRIVVTVAPVSGSLLLNRFKLFGFGGENVVINSTTNSKNYTLTNNGSTLTEVTDTLSAAVIKSKGVNHVVLTPAMLATLGGNFKLISGVASGIQTVLSPLSQMVISVAPKNLGSYAAISKATLTATLTNAGKVAVAFSRNMTDWYVYSNGWVKIATPTTTAASADALLANGMTAATVAAITQAQWATFFGGADAQLDGLAVAFALSAPATADNVTVKSLTLTVNETNSWKVQTPAEVEIRWRNNSVSFKTITAGDFKFIYQAP